jgi:hypothetical protein
MPAGRSSNKSSNRLSSFHLVVSSLGVLVGIAIAVYQIAIPSTAPAPVNVTVTVDPAKLQQAQGGTEVQKTSDAAAAMKADGLSGERLVDLSNARFSAALNDGSDSRYAFSNLFDGSRETALTFAGSDTEINVLVDFGSAAALPLAGITYSPPVPAEGVHPATLMDVMVLPEGQMGVSGGKVYNFVLQTDQGRQSFALPPGTTGKGLWLRIATNGATGPVAVGEFSLVAGK